MRRQLIRVSLAAALSVAIFQLSLAMADDPLSDAIASYRTGHYAQAQKTLSQVHQDDPANIRATYYLAITQARLGRYDEARQHYAEVQTLAPNSTEAAMAREGLQYLPAPGQLDRPPQPEQAALHTLPSQSSATVVQTPQPYNAPNAGGLSPQDMMAMEMMMGGNGNNNNNNNFNPMALMNMQQQQGGDPNSNHIDPSVMSTMMMNQMLQNFNFDSGNGNK